MLEGNDREYRGVYLNAELQDDENLQHWKRVLITLLNSAEFSVRSVAIDLFVTLVGEIFDEYGCIDSFTFFILKKLHESKEEWVYRSKQQKQNLLCVRAICDAIPHIPNVWQPFPFKLWRDPNRSSWLMYLAKSNLQVSLRKKAVKEILLFSE